jgi:hypothetical protein
MVIIVSLLPKWVDKYLTLSVSRKEKKEFLIILETIFGNCGARTDSVAQHMQVRGFISDVFDFEERAHIVNRIGSHLIKEGKVSFCHRDQIWCLTKRRMISDRISSYIINRLKEM